MPEVDLDLEITPDEGVIAGQEAVERDQAEGHEPIPDPVAPPPVPGQDNTPQPSPAEMVAKMSVTEQMELLKRFVAERSQIDAMIELLEEETQAADGVGYMEHVLALVAEMEELIRPIRLGGQFMDEQAPHRKLMEIKSWLMQGLTEVVADEEAKKQAESETPES